MATFPLILKEGPVNLVRESGTRGGRSHCSSSHRNRKLTGAPSIRIFTYLRPR